MYYLFFLAKIVRINTKKRFVIELIEDCRCNSGMKLVKPISIMT